jgi:hypothetical protein
MEPQVLPTVVVAKSIYSPTEIIFMVTTIIAAITTMGVALITAWRTSARVDKIGQETRQVVEKAGVVRAEQIEIVSQKLEEIHTSTNNNFEQQQQEIRELRVKLETAGQAAIFAEAARLALAEEARRALEELAKHRGTQNS